MKKATVLTAAVMLLAQTVCLASPFACGCLSPMAADEAVVACHCGDVQLGEISPLACPHCQSGHAPGNSPPSSDEDAINAEVGCQCRLTVPSRQEPVPAPETHSNDESASVLLDLNAVRPEPVYPVRLSASDVPPPDIRLARFKQVLLCVWLT